MKCSKHFATENGQSHLPSNMIHVPEALASNSRTVDGTPLIMLTLTRRTTAKPTELRIRMTVDEARRLVADIQSRIDNAQPVISIPAGDSLVLDEAQHFLERHALQYIADRLEYLRGELRAERITYGELAELQGLAPHIDPSDVELREAAGIPEFADADEPEEPTCPACGGPGLVLGQLGSRIHFRCRNCGIDFSHKAGE